MNNAINKEGNESGRAVAWEKAFIQLAKVYLLFCFCALAFPLFKLCSLNILYLHCEICENVSFSFFVTSMSEILPNFEV